MFEQYWSIKETLPDKVLLFYRMGDFYELFGHDAVEAASVMEVQLTARAKDADVPVPMCGVPAHSAEIYIERALKKGLSVAIAEQLEEAGGGKKLVRRGIVRVHTPALCTQLDAVGAQEPNYLLVLDYKQRDGLFDVIVFDLLSQTRFTGVKKREEEVWDLLRWTKARELLVAQSLAPKFSDLTSVAVRPWADAGSALEILTQYLQFALVKPRSELSVLMGAEQPLSYLFASKERNEALISDLTLVQWDIEPHLRQTLDRCATSMGSRFLREWMRRPLAKTMQITGRQQLMRALESSAPAIHASLQGIYDGQRVMGRILAGAGQVKDLWQIATSLKRCQDVFAQFGALFESVSTVAQAEGLKPFGFVCAEVNKTFDYLDTRMDLEVDFQKLQSGHQIYKKGFDAELDALRSVHEDGEAWLTGFEDQLKASTQISTLKVRFNRVLGFYIEVTKAQLGKVPKSFERKSSTVSAERFTTKELQEREQLMLSAESKLEQKIQAIIMEALSFLSGRADQLRDVFAWVAFVDANVGVLRAIRSLERYGTWIWPKLEDRESFSFEITEGRHPLIESRLGRFVPNTVCLGESAQVLLLTGPNMAGKSTLMRQCGLLLYLAQLGFPVPAKAMSLSPARAFFSRMGASDRILEGESTFMVEMQETALILSQSDAWSFVLVDEVGRGTSTQDGLAIARAVLEHLVEHNGARCIFATHFHELSEIGLSVKGVQNASMDLKEWKGELVFLRQLKLEAATKSYGLYVAKLAGLPPSLLKKAKSYFDGFGLPQSQLSLFVNTPSTSLEPHQNPTTQVSIEHTPWLEKLEGLDLEAMSPKQAWAFLEEWKHAISEDL